MLAATLSAAAFAKLLSPSLAPHDAARLATGLYMALTFAFAVVGHGRKDPEARPEDDDEDGEAPGAR